MNVCDDIYIAFISFTFQQTAERGDRNQRVCEDSEGEAKGIRAQLSSLDEDKGHTGARHRSQG